MTRIKMHIFKVKLPFYPPCEVKCGLQNRVSTPVSREGEIEDSLWGFDLQSLKLQPWRLRGQVRSRLEKKREWAGFRDRTTVGGGGDASSKLCHGGHELLLREREHSRDGSDRPLSPSPIPVSPPPPPKRRHSSSDQSDWSFCLGLAGFCWGLSCGLCCLGLETVKVDLDFEWSCCLGLEIERVVLVGNEWENSGSSMKK